MGTRAQACKYLIEKICHLLYSFATPIFAILYLFLFIFIPLMYTVRPQNIYSILLIFLCFVSKGLNLRLFLRLSDYCNVNQDLSVITSRVSLHVVFKAH